ncbi:MAG: hypothetical protein KTR20_03075 [Cellvibrionaceae bacterium]|nr:hypothetical protein [Cellvibrionaceae bacterium]
MSMVKPSKQFRMTVVPYRPWLRLTCLSAFFVLFTAAVIGSFFLGHYYAVGDYSHTVAERDQLKAGYQQGLSKINQLQQRVANLNLGAQVDRKANEAVRAEVVELKSRVAELEQDNSFYRDLMSPAPGDKGIIVDTPAVSAAEVVGNYKYTVVIKQIAAKHNTVSGYLEVFFVGTQGDASVRLALKEVSDKVNANRIRLRFKYFQRIEGQMVLPEGFVPQHIELKVVAQSPKSVVIEKKFGWSSKES